MILFILIAVMAAIFYWYVYLVIHVFGVLHSISQSYYSLKDRGNTWTFTMFCWSLAALTGTYTVHLLPYEHDAWILFFTVGGLAFTGAANSFKEAWTDWVHYVGAAVAFGAALISILVIIGGVLGILPILLSTLFVLTGIVSRMKNLIFWAEVVMFSLILAGLFIINYHAV